VSIFEIFHTNTVYKKIIGHEKTWLNSSILHSWLIFD
jgi:hypothetical protein